MEPDRDFIVLIVSDNKSGLDILDGILSTYYDIKRASSTEEALFLMKNEEVNLIILDYTTQNTRSSKFLAKIKSSEKTMRIPIILIGDSSHPEDEERGFALGAVDYISKPFRASIVKVRVNNQRLIVKQIKAIEELGLLDPLTGISNRRGFDSRIHSEWLRAIREKSCITLAVADIDHFKTYNDDYGHLQGDVLLRTLAKEFVSMLKRPADFVARWGGEEFVIVLPNTESEGAMAHLEDIRKSVQKMVVPDLPPATISIGFSTITPTVSTSMEDFFTTADKALYQAKNTGRNKVCCL